MGSIAGYHVECTLGEHVHRGGGKIGKRLFTVLQKGTGYSRDEGAAE
jgi:hypothetical protein